MKALDTTALLLIIIGGVNWGLVGAFEFNLVDSLLGEGSGVSRVVYVLVGLAAVYSVVPLVNRLADNTTEAER